MDFKKLLCAAASLAMAASIFTGCGKSEESSVSKAESSAASEIALDENAEAAEKLLTDLSGTYHELWPVILADDYRQTWLDDSAKLVGEENAEGAFEKMSSMVTGTVIGEDAVKKYADGSELFEHTYHYIGMEDIRGLYIYESDDADSGEFTYFCMAPDTMATTWHIEFRYGSDLDALKQYDAGEYAYWLASGISVDYTADDVSNCIELFCTENLSE